MSEESGRRPFHRPTLRPTEFLEELAGGVDPLEAAEAAHRTAELVVGRGRDTDDPQVVHAGLLLAGEHLHRDAVAKGARELQPHRLQGPAGDQHLVGPDPVLLRDPRPQARLRGPVQRMPLHLVQRGLRGSAIAEFDAARVQTRRAVQISRQRQFRMRRGFRDERREIHSTHSLQGKLAVVLCLLFGSIAVVGLNTLIRHQVDLSEPRNLIIVSVTLVFGIGGMKFGGDGFALSGISLCALTAMLLNLLLPGGEGWKSRALDGDGDQAD